MSLFDRHLWVFTSEISLLTTFPRFTWFEGSCKTSVLLVLSIDVTVWQTRRTNGLLLCFKRGLNIFLLCRTRHIQIFVGNCANDTSKLPQTKTASTISFLGNGLSLGWTVTLKNIGTATLSKKLSCPCPLPKYLHIPVTRKRISRRLIG